MISAVLPVLLGIVMYFLIGPIGAIFMLLSPILLIGSVIEARRTGQYEFKEALAEHGVVVAEQVHHLEQQRVEEVRGRFRELPGAGRARRHRAQPVRPAVGAGARRRGLPAPAGRARPSCRRGRRSRWPAVGPGTCAASWRRSPAASASSTTCRSPSTCSSIGGVGLAGPMASTRALARSMVVQAATMHSPTDLAVVALVGEGGLTDWTFLKWLPHSRSLGGSQLASTSHHALALVDALLQARTGSAAGSTLPAVLVVIDETCPVERRRLMPLIEAGRDSGITFLWVTSARHRLPKACGAVVEIDPDHVTARTGFTGSGLTVAPTRWEGMSLDDAVAVARGITPVIDITGRVNDDSEIPSAVTFAELYGGGPILDDPTSILELWQQHEGGHADHGLRVVVGMQAGAPFVLDIRQDGPHALVAGTTGAGKSEFLQAFIVGLATMHSPERVTFLLVDYKGGAAFKECVALPHTVGMVTDLDRNEVRRALISLNAELHHRELLLQAADAKDLLEMERKGHPRDAAEPADRRRRVRRPGQGGARVRRRRRRRRPPRPQPRTPPRARHPAPGRRHHRADPGQHQPAHRPAHGRRRRVGRRRRLARRRGHRAPAARPGRGPHRSPGAGAVPERLRRRAHRRRRPGAAGRGRACSGSTTTRRSPRSGG